jgi:exopolyphosphatase/guanosine-5'-triphosphate,3'-diphosphate pyrophosphatase
VAGCLNLLDRKSDAALVVDVGGGSTEISWVDLSAKGDAAAKAQGEPPIRAWLSVPIGVVTLAERFPEGERATHDWFRGMVEHIKAEIAAFRRADPLREVFAADRAHMIGTSGAITSLAGMHLGLRRYDRSRVDGIWMTRGECEAAADSLLGLTARERADQPCIGPDRADLVLAGAAILQAVQELWPCSRVRVADRGLREGILMSLMAERGGRRRKRRRGGGGAQA